MNARWCWDLREPRRRRVRAGEVASVLEYNEPFARAIIPVKLRFPKCVFLGARERGGKSSLKGISEDNLSPRGTFLFRSRIKPQWHRFITCFVGTLLVPPDGRWKERPCSSVYTRAFSYPFTYIQHARRVTLSHPRGHSPLKNLSVSQALSSGYKYRARCVTALLHRRGNDKSISRRAFPGLSLLGRSVAAVVAATTARSTGKTSALQPQP